MAKTKEELTQLKVEYETLNNKLKELTEDELKMVIGGYGTYDGLCPYYDIMNYYDCNRPLKGSSPACLTVCKWIADGNIAPAMRRHLEIDDQ